MARKHVIGRIDKVENRFVGVEHRGCYESTARDRGTAGQRVTAKGQQGSERDNEEKQA